MIMKIFRNPWAFGFLIFFSLGFLLSPFVGVRVCKDGWRSSLIGSQGACSWHGGVGGLDHGGWVGPVRVIAGIIAGLSMASLNDSRRNQAPVSPPTKSPKSTTQVIRKPIEGEEDLGIKSTFSPDQLEVFAKNTREAEKRLEEYLANQKLAGKKKPN